MASNNPADYIHPIIQAYISSQQLQQRQREFIASQEQEKLMREQRAKEFDATLKLSQQNADRLEKAQNLVRNSAVAAEAHRIRQEIATGLRKPQTVQEGGSLATQLPFYVDENNPLGPVVAEDIVTPQDLRIQKEQELAGQTPLLADRAGKIMEAQVKARAPELEAREAGLFERLTTQNVARHLENIEQHKRRMEEIALQNQGRIAARGSTDEGGKLLSPNDALALGVEYGTKRREAFGREVNKPLTQSDQTKLQTLESLEGLIDRAISLGTSTNFSAHGVLYTGTIKSAIDNLRGIPDENVDAYRDVAGNLEGTIAREQGGTSFTPNEQRLLNRYNVNLNDAPKRAQIKLIELQKFVKDKIKNMRSPAFRRRTPEGAAPAVPQGGTGRVSVGRDPVTGALR